MYAHLQLWTSSTYMFLIVFNKPKFYLNWILLLVVKFAAICLKKDPLLFQSLSYATLLLLMNYISTCLHKLEKNPERTFTFTKTKVKRKIVLSVCFAGASMKGAHTLRPVRAIQAPLHDPHSASQHWSPQIWTASVSICALTQLPSYVH